MTALSPESDWNGRHFRARTRHKGHSYFIGWYATEQEAKEAVVRFRQRKGWPVTREQMSKAISDGTILGKSILKGSRTGD